MMPTVIERLDGRKISNPTPTYAELQNRPGTGVRSNTTRSAGDSGDQGSRGTGWKAAEIVWIALSTTPSFVTFGRLLVEGKVAAKDTSLFLRRRNVVDQTPVFTHVRGSDGPVAASNVLFLLLSSLTMDVLP
jgi:hypothetical protein